MSDLYFALTIDLDPDNFDTSIFGPRRTLSWRGVEDGLPSLLELVRDVRDTNDQELRFTWFVRADTELQETYGTYAYLFEHYAKFLAERTAKGDEVGWHPHVATLDQLEMSYHALRDSGLMLSSVRIGNAFHSNNFMAALARWGFQVDSTAIPGRVRNDEERVLDWEQTSRKPYFPSVHDYRIPGSSAHSILEVPMSMIDTKVSYDRSPIPRYLNLSYKHAIIRDSIADLIRQEELLVAIIHPSELLKMEREHPLIAFDAQTVLTNLTFIVEQAESRGRRVRFLTVSRVAELVAQRILSYAQ